MKSASEVLTEMAEGLNESAAAQLRLIAGKVGENAVVEAHKLAEEVASESGLDPQRCLVGALWLSQFVGEFRGYDVDADPDRQYSCPVCFDNGYQILEGGARPCPACDLGLGIEALNWLDCVRPRIANTEKRYDSIKGRKLFEKAMHHLPTRKARLIERMNEIEKRGKAKSKEGWD